MKLVAKNISKSIKKEAILSNINIDIEQGEIVLLLGPNGAGKTTSFYILSGVIPSTTGKILLDNKDITNYPLHMRSKLGIGYLPQENSIFENLSVEDNLKLVLELKHKNLKDINTKLNILLNDFKLDKIRYNIGYLLSGGEKKRLEIARTIALEPKFLLLDEPFAGIDPIALNDIKSIILALKKQNIGIAITDHNVKEVIDLADKIYLIYDGKAIFYGDKYDFINNDFAKNIYLGENFFEKK